MKKPGDPNPDPPGGRARERLDEFIEQRQPQTPPPADADEQPGKAPAGSRPDADAPGEGSPSS